MEHGHEPRLYKAFGAVMLGGGLIMVGFLFSGGQHTTLVVFGVLSASVGVIEAGFCYFKNIADTQHRHYLVQKEVIDSLAKADPDVRNAIGAWFPRYNFIYAGQPIICWQDTIVPLDIFREFMKESNQQYTAPERNWKAKGATYHRYWNLIYEKLVEIDLVVRDSSAGSHSYMWSGSGYDRSWQMWMTHSMNLPELD